MRCLSKCLTKTAVIYYNSLVTIISDNGVGIGMELLLKAKDERFWLKVRTDNKYADLIDSVKKIYGQSKTQPVTVLPYSDRKQFKATGSRHEFEKAYFIRRQYLTATALLALLYSENGEYLNELQDIIWATCEEFSWALPAHTADLTVLQAQTHIDLFAAETGFTLAEIICILGDRLDSDVVERVKTEVQRRIINSYLGSHFGWETDRGNWAAVCSGCVGGTFIYLAPDKFKAVQNRIDETLKYFLQSFTDEGVCEEGLGYWQYGFGSFVWYADLLLQFTNGDSNYFADAKVEKIAAYAQKNVMCGNSVVSFCDSSPNEKIHGALMRYLADKYPDSVRELPSELTSRIYGNTISNDGNWIRCIRDFFFLGLNRKNKRFVKRNYDFISSGQVIINEEKYSLAVKANHNGEPHNHNDVGTFILATGEGQIFCDLGAGQYSAEYFDLATRYNFLCNSSRGHSVPIINGCCQKAGKRFCGTIEHKGNEITAELAGAYEAGIVGRATRKFRCFDNRVELTDSFDFEGENGQVTDRFVTLFEPQISNDFITVGNVKMLFDKDCCKVKISSEQQAVHNGSGETETVYLMDFELHKEIHSAKFVFEII